MPGFIKTPEDEKTWEKAKAQAEKAGHKDNWAYVTQIYKSMHGGKVAGSAASRYAVVGVYNRSMLQTLKKDLDRHAEKFRESGGTDYGFVGDADHISDVLDGAHEFLTRTSANSRYANSPFGVAAVELSSFLALLRAAHQAHWTAHWTVSGDNFYGDHLMFERLYTSITAEIDGLAEKIVKMCGPESVRLSDQLAMMHKLANRWETQPDAIARAEMIESDIQIEVDAVHAVLKREGVMTMGMDNFLQGVADAHETPEYLLGQRSSITKSLVERVANAYVTKKTV